MTCDLCGPKFWHVKPSWPCVEAQRQGFGRKLRQRIHTLHHCSISSALLLRMHPFNDRLRKHFTHACSEILQSTALSHRHAAQCGPPTNAFVDNQLIVELVSCDIAVSITLATASRRYLQHLDCLENLQRCFFKVDHTVLTGLTQTTATFTVQKMVLPSHALRFRDQLIHGQ